MGRNKHNSAGHNINRLRNMKKELSSIELKYLLDEFQQLVDGKIDKIYQPGKQDVLFSFHVPGIGKKMLRTALPGMMWFAALKPEMPVNISYWIQRTYRNPTQIT